MTNPSQRSDIHTKKKTFVIDVRVQCGKDACPQYRESVSRQLLRKTIKTTFLLSSFKFGTIWSSSCAKQLALEPLALARPETETQFA